MGDEDFVGGAIEREAAAHQARVAFWVDVSQSSQIGGRAAVVHPGGFEGLRLVEGPEVVDLDAAAIRLAEPTEAAAEEFPPEGAVLAELRPGIRFTLTDQIDVPPSC